MNSVTVIIPAYNEEKTIGTVIDFIRNQNIIKPEIIIVDNCSCDKTKEIAENKNVKVVSCNIKGKGAAMLQGLKHSSNDIVVFLDADINNYTRNLIDILAQPIINNEVDFVKSTFDRQGGRITELVAKPLLKLVFPEMEYYSQPLSGMIAARKNVFNSIEFEQDYGVDIGILLDVLNLEYKIKEVHIGRIDNDSQPWNSLEKMASEVIHAILKRSNYTK